jgi:hypothetical protein
MAEASQRVSRYLGTQVIVNLLFGLPFGTALHFIGIPNALLFGLLGMVLRFIPYVGVWIAAAMPAALAFAISDSWSPVAWTLGVFLALEGVLAYVIEPWLYGRSAGLTPIAIMAAVIFWTWLWGPIGLLLATPLTVCITVLGRHIPEFGYFNVLLGVEPVLAPEERLYQRLIALDPEEASELAESYAAAHGAGAALEEVLLPALALAKHDRARGSLEPARERFVCEQLRRLIEELDAKAPKADAAAPICIVPAHDEGDQLAALMAAKLLPASRCTVLAPGASGADIARVAAERRCGAILICAVPPNAAHHAGQLARRLRAELPDAKLVVLLWSSGGDSARGRERLLALGVEAVVPRLRQACDALLQATS